VKREKTDTKASPLFFLVWFEYKFCVYI